MSPQRDDRITKWAQEQHMEEGDNQWILGSPTTILKMGSQSASIATNTDIWQRNAEQRRRNEIHELSQIRYLLVVILELNSVSEVQYKGMMTDR